MKLQDIECCCRNRDLVGRIFQEDVIEGMMRKKILWVAGIVAVVLLPLGLLHTYPARSECNGSLFWNNHEAYLIVGVGQFGYRTSYLGHAAEFVREIFPFGASSPIDKHFSVHVIRVLSNSIQKFSVDNFWLGSAYVIGGTIYASDMRSGMNGGPMKWSGTSFVPASAGERQQIERILNSGKYPFGPSFDNLDGWSKRVAGGEVIRESATDYVEKDAVVESNLDGEAVTFTMNSGFISHQAYVELSRTPQPIERIWSLDERTQYLSKEQYWQIFGRH